MKTLYDNSKKEKIAYENAIKIQDVHLQNQNIKLQKIYTGNKNWEEAYQLLQEHRREDGENINYLQNVLNNHNIKY